jgi:hypothetical protein
VIGSHSCGGTEISKQGKVSQHQHRGAQDWQSREGAGALTKSHTKIKNWLQAQLVEGQLLGWFG